MKKLFLIGMVIVIGGAWLRITSSVISNSFQLSANEVEEEEHEKESGADKQMANWWWSRAYPDPTDINHKYYNAWLHAKAMKTPELLYGTNGTQGTNNTNLFSGDWTAIGPDQNIGGRILSIAIDPVN